ncbi:MAG: alkyl sulfatase dimerization domain-containing protein [Eudoraea sp.]|uniref:alkyl sulfatase dimerization domain-containing protein n=1 Tax=Eudoraea sp. TaxID=1979955 RepID=UPI0032676E53
MKAINFKILVTLTLLIFNRAFSQEQNIYMGGQVELTEMSNGGIINSKAPESIIKTMPHEPKIVHLAEGIWSIEGFAHVNCGVIEGEESLIVYDTGNDNVDGQKFLEAIKQVSDKPVKTIIYSHAHYVWGSRPLLDGAEDYTVVGHPKINQNITESGGKGASIPEIAPVLTARSNEQFDVYVPAEGRDAPLASSPLGKNEKEFVPVNRPVSNGEVLTIDGVTMQFFTDYHSDTDDCLTVYFPEKGLVLNNLYWPVYPNLYTLRGSIYRDPVPLMEGLKIIRDLHPEYLISTHTFSISGKDDVFEAITNYHDGLAYLYDQTIRHILLGDSPDEMRHNIQLPEHLDLWPNNQRTYGELSYYPPNIYVNALGWYDGNAANINPVHPDIEAQKIVAGFGGKQKTMNAIKEALENEEFAWATQLSDYLYKVNPSDQEVRQIKADALRKMGQLTVASIPRSWYLSQARALENKVKIPHMVLPSKEEVLSTKPGTYVNLFRVRINPELSQNTDKVLVFEFTDLDENANFGLHIRRGVAEYILEPNNYHQQQHITIKLTRSLFAAYFIGETSLKELIDSNPVEIIGNKKEAFELLMQFDQIDPSKTRYKFQNH